MKRLVGELELMRRRVLPFSSCKDSAGAASALAMSLYYNRRAGLNAALWVGRSPWFRGACRGPGRQGIAAQLVDGAVQGPAFLGQARGRHRQRMKAEIAVDLQGGL